MRDRITRMKDKMKCKQIHWWSRKCSPVKILFPKNKCLGSIQDHLIYQGQLWGRVLISARMFFVLFWHFYFYNFCLFIYFEVIFLASLLLFEQDKEKQETIG